MMFRKDINRTPQTVRWHLSHLCTMQGFTVLDIVERSKPENFFWYSGWLRQLALTCTIWLRLTVSAGSYDCYWFLFDVCYWTGLLVTWQRRVELAQEIMSKQVHNHLFQLISFSLTSGQWVRREVETFKNPK